MLACASIERALRLQNKLQIVPYAHVSPEWPLTGGLPIHYGGAGKSQQHIVRIWDTGATQGMTDIGSAEQSRVFEDAPIAIQTGHGVTHSKHWIDETLAPGIDMQHVILPDTANTDAVGGLNERHGLGFTWPESLASQSNAAKPCVVKTSSGCILYQGTFQILPMRLSANTPERGDNDPVITLELDHWASPCCSCNR